MKVTSTVHHPTLTEEERARRLKDIHQAAVDLVLATERQKAAKAKK